MFSSVVLKPTLRFRRWSRNAYATFCSVGRCVTIGVVKGTIVEAAERKQPTGLRALVSLVGMLSLEELTELTPYRELFDEEYFFEQEGLVQVESAPIYSYSIICEYPYSRKV